MIFDVIIISEKCICIKGLFVLNYINIKWNLKCFLLLCGYRFWMCDIGVRIDSLGI